MEFIAFWNHTLQFEIDFRSNMTRIFYLVSREIGGSVSRNVPSLLPLLFGPAYQNIAKDSEWISNILTGLFIQNRWILVARTSS